MLHLRLLSWRKRRRKNSKQQIQWLEIRVLMDSRQLAIWLVVSQVLQAIWQNEKLVSLIHLVAKGSIFLPNFFRDRKQLRLKMIRSLKRRKYNFKLNKICTLWEPLVNLQWHRGILEAKDLKIYQTSWRKQWRFMDKLNLLKRMVKMKLS